MPDGLLDKATGFLVEPGDVEGCAEAILQILSNKNMASQIGRNNRKWAKELTWERYAQKQFEIYRNL